MALNILLRIMQDHLVSHSLDPLSFLTKSSKSESMTSRESKQADESVRYCPGQDHLAS